MIKPALSHKIKIIFWAILLFLISHFLLKISLLIPLTLFSLWFYLKIKNIKHNLLYLGLLYSLIFTSSYFILKNNLAFYYLPFATLPILTTILFNSLEITLLISLAAAVSLASLANNSLSLAILFSTTGILSAVLARDIRRRSEIIKVGIIIGFYQAIFVFIIEKNSFLESFKYLINGFVCSLIVLGVQPFFEIIFKTITNISLLELADFNHPLLQRMILEAPGTYHHSLVVGNLSEAASRSVGANALLARVGAYYHDIGKIEKASYFSENQSIQENKHQNLSPSISKMVIMNHVKEGVDLARRYKLNPRIIDFILEHHGTSLVYYFYRRALENLEEDQVIKEDGFRYPGPKPNTKETAIVLLADSVEAATRALGNPDHEKIREVVYKIINNKFIDGQLDECDLTLKDLEKIAKVFIHILTGIYHSRITYPG